MKHWWQTVVKDYFSFSKRDRIGILVMLLIGAAFYFLPKFSAQTEEKIDNSAFEQDIAGLKISIDTTRSNRNFKNYDDDRFDYYQPKKYAFENTPKGELFTFDPNTLDEAGWKRLGLRDKTIATIQKFIAKGYKFRKPEDIKKIYGLRENDAERLLPFVVIGGSDAEVTPMHFANNSPNNFEAKPKSAYVAKAIEINSADSTALISLPGIGSKLAARILSFRDKLGGFASVEQVKETYGLPDSTFQKIKDRFQCNSSAIKKFNINTADINQLKLHPYIRWNIANVIINYRLQHGNYKSIDDLKKIDLISNEVFNKIAPYLTV